MAKQHYSPTRRRRSRCASSSRARSAWSFERTILDALTASIAVINRSGTIIAVNAAWEEFARTNGDPTLTHTGVGVNYLDVCRRAEGAEEAPQVLAGLEALLAGALTQFTLEYPCHSPTERRWFLLHASPLRTSGGGAVVSHTDITQRTLAEEQRALLLQREQWARAAAEEATQHVVRLQQVTSALGTALTPDEVAHIILSQGIAALGAKAGSVVVRTEDGTMLEVLHAVGYPADLIEQWQCFPLDAATPLSDAVRTGQSVLLESRATGAERYPALTMMESIFGDGAIAAFPLVVQNEVIGGLGMSFQHARTFATEEVAFMLNLVQQCAQALERARLYRSEQQAHAEAEEAVRGEKPEPGRRCLSVDRGTRVEKSAYHPARIWAAFGAARGAGADATRAGPARTQQHYRSSVSAQRNGWRAARRFIP